ncbi:RNI-like protein [Dioscorea alata]|uniref:RNI-like protein n=1 Tax=Dioscorea alata TaxID=55571 RepID=A0ACB7UZH0_DIOAL|nr:RNI-like protein [Dioscorea alata]
MNGSGADLRHLDLGHLQNLKNIVWKGMVPQQFFCNLQLLTINECRKLSSLSWVMRLPSLTELSVQVCEGIKELFTEEDGEIQQVSEAPSFPNLRSLTLEHLPNLVSMSNQALDFPLLCSFPIFNCPNLKRLVFKPDIVNKEFVQIHCVKEWWERLEWEDDTIQSFLSRFINFIEMSHYLSTVPF